MRSRQRTKMINHLLDKTEAVAYLQERVRLANGNTLAVIRKNLFYALRDQEELCKIAGLKDSTSLFKNLQQEEVI